MAKGILVRNKPYKIRGSEETKQISLNALCGFQEGDLIYQVKRTDGVIELIPEGQFVRENYL